MFRIAGIGTSGFSKSGGNEAGATLDVQLSQQHNEVMKKLLKHESWRFGDKILVIIHCKDASRKVNRQEGNSFETVLSNTGGKSELWCFGRS